MSEPATGWAVVSGSGQIDVRTVCETRRAALVNWLVVHKKLSITVFDSDDDIERWWHHHSGQATCTTVTVALTPRS